MEKVLIILRGLPGCGKTTLANLIGNYVCSADDYHMIDGQYVWKQENVHRSHEYCRDKVEYGMAIDMTKIVVANTSTTEKELEPYYELAKKYGYTVFSVVVENRHNGVNVHNVPEETLKKMRSRFHISL